MEKSAINKNTAAKGEGGGSKSDDGKVSRCVSICLVVEADALKKGGGGC
jgi:hypothetical protein